MGLTLLATSDTQIIRVVEALYKQTPGYNYLTNFRTFVTENSIDDFANALGANFASSTDAELAAIVTSNLGLTGDALTAGNTYLEGQFAATPAARGQVILAAMNALSGLEGDATYGAAAAAFNASIVDSLSYSIVVANTDALAVGVGQTFSLTTGIDTLVGTSNNDTFSAGEIAAVNSWTVGDTVNGGAGDDTINIVDTAAIALPTAATLTNVEQVNVTAGTTVVLDTTTFSGVTGLTSVAVGGTTLTAAATTAIVASQADAAATDEAIVIEGGSTVAVTSTVNDADTITIGGTTAAAGAVTVNSASTTAVGANTQGAITVDGGTVITVNQTAANLANTGTATTAGAVDINGNASTTAVTVTDTAAQTGVTATVNVVGTSGRVNGAVAIDDLQAASLTVAGTITTVTVDSGAAVSVNSGALTTLNASGTMTTLDAGTLGALTTAANTTLALNLTGLTSTGAVTIDADITTLNIASTTNDSTLASLVASGATTVNVSGDKLVTLTADTLTAVTAINVTNTAGASFGTAIGTAVVFTGGAGADTVTTTTAMTAASTLGAGNDTVTYGGVASVVATLVGSMAAGTGTDTIIMTDTQAAAADGTSAFNTAWTGFETLQVSDALTTDDLDVDGLNNVSTVILATGATTATINNLDSGGTVQFTDTDSTGTTTIGVDGASFSASDVLNLTISNSGDVYAVATVAAANVETINITANDKITADTDITTLGSDATINTMTLTAAAATTITVSGNNGLTLANTASVAVTTFDASGVVANDTVLTSITGTSGALVVAAVTTDTAANLAVAYTSANVTTTAAVAITGGAGNDTLTGAAAVDTITGGEGADILNGGAGIDSIILTETTAAIDKVFVAANGGNDTITGFTAGATVGDIINLSEALIQLDAAGTADTDWINIDLGTQSVANSDAVVVSTITGATDAVTLTTDTDILIANLAANIASASALETALELGGSLALTMDGAVAAKDVFLVAYDDGTNSYLAHVEFGAIVADDALAAVGGLTATVVATLVGVADVTTLVAGNFDIIA